MFWFKKNELEQELADKDAQISQLSKDIAELKATFDTPIYKAALEQAQIAAEKQRQYDALVGENLSYPIIRDLINSARHGVQIRLILKSGETLVFEQTDAYKNLVNQFRSETF